jgi:hypothetical protein
MSWVTNVMVSVSSYDNGTAAEFAAWLADKPYQYLRRSSWPNATPYPWPDDREWTGPYIGFLAESPDLAWPGSKAHECHVWLGVLNTADLDKVREHFAGLPWQLPNAVQLFMLDQEQSFFRLWMLRDGALREVVMPPRVEDDDGFWPERIAQKFRPTQ